MSMRDIETDVETDIEMGTPVPVEGGTPAQPVVFNNSNGNSNSSSSNGNNDNNKNFDTPSNFKNARMPEISTNMWRAIGGAVLLTIILLLASLRTVPAASVGVVITAGNVWGRTLSPGVHFTSPISGLHSFSTKTILIEQENEVPTKEGLSVTLDVGILFHIDPARAREIYLNLGKNYDELVVQPELSSAVRGMTSESEAKELYTEGRTTLQTKLREEMSRKLEPRGIIVEDVLLKALKLPEQLTHSIELKAQAEQESARMAFVLEKERQEAERKSIEATGIADFQRIVSEGISDKLLSWKGIEATERLAESSNAKVVFVGNSQDSLPVLLSAQGNH